MRLVALNPSSGAFFLDPAPRTPSLQGLPSVWRVSALKNLVLPSVPLFRADAADSTHVSVKDTTMTDCPNCGSRLSVDETGYCNAGCQKPKPKPPRK